MNKLYVKNLEAGLEIDACVQSMVMNGMPIVGYDIIREYIPAYSTDISDAWKVWDMLVYLERYPTLQEGITEDGEPFIAVTLVNPTVDYFGEDESAALSICKAAVIGVLSKFYNEQNNE